MFTNNQITKGSIKIAKDADNTFYYTDLTREEASKDFEKLPDTIISNDGFKPTAPTSIKQRFVTMLLGSAGCGKSFYVNKLVKDYKENYPNGEIFYISACDLDEDPSYEESRKYINEIDVFKMETSIDFKAFNAFEKSLVIFDDTDSAFSTSQDYKLVAPNMTKEEYDKLPIKSKKQISNEIVDKCNMASVNVNNTLLSLIKNGRKFNISVLYISHKPFDGRIQSNMISECTSIVLYPSSTNRDTLKTFLNKKLSLNKDQAKRLMTFKKWYMYDYLEIFYRVSRPFFVSDNVISIIEDF